MKNHALMARLLPIMLIVLSSSWAAAAERTVVVTGAGGVALAGTLSVPDKAQGPVPALLLIQGSGPTDRDGNQATGRATNLLQQVATFLAQRGIASLRLDKRGSSANRSQAPSDTADLAQFYRWQNFVDDDVAAFRFLAQQPGIDAARTGIFGHSEGGMLALEVATRATEQTSDLKPALLVLASTPGRPADRVLREQLLNLMARQKVTPQQSEFFTAAIDRIQTGLRASEAAPSDVPPGLTALFPAYLAAFLHEQFQLDPAKAAAAFKGPVLILQGGADAKVSPERDAEALDHALAARRPDDHQLLIAAGVTHPLKPLGEDLAGPISPEILTALGAWLEKHLKP